MRYVLTLAVAFLSVFSLPAPAHATATWSGFGFITEIDQQSGYHGVWIITDTTIANDNCSGTPGSYFLPDDGYSPANAQYKSDLALVMGAYLNNRPVAFYVSGCTSLGNPLVAAIRVQ